jgi:hypothetical protein
MRDTGPRGAIVVSVDGTTVDRVQFAALDVVRFASVAVCLEGIRTADDLIERVAASIRAACRPVTYRALVVRLILRGSGLGALLAAPAGSRTELVGHAVALAVPVPVWLESVWAELTVPAPYRFRLDASAPTLEVS